MIPEPIERDPYPLCKCQKKRDLLWSTGIDLRRGSSVVKWREYVL